MKKSNRTKRTQKSFEIRVQEVRLSLGSRGVAYFFVLVAIVYTLVRLR